MIAFNLATGWACDVTRDIASALVSCAQTERRQLSKSAEMFVETVLGQNASIGALK